MTFDIGTYKEAQKDQCVAITSITKAIERLIVSFNRFTDQKKSMLGDISPKLEKLKTTVTELKSKTTVDKNKMKELLQMSEKLYTDIDRKLIKRKTLEHTGNANIWYPIWWKFPQITTNISFMNKYLFFRMFEEHVPIQNIPDHIYISNFIHKTKETLLLPCINMYCSDTSTGEMNFTNTSYSGCYVKGGTSFTIAYIDEEVFQQIKNSFVSLQETTMLINDDKSHSFIKTILDEDMSSHIVKWNTTEVQYG
ncbi:MAG: hypothetical protein GY804_08995 [Alphaproteobacteria bacterium]|nr:hypothetical protein [Alphaproteobacteria bacterium]